MMSFLEKIKSMFKEQAEEVIEISYENALERIEKEMKDHKEKVLNSAYSESKNIHSKLQELYDVFDNFEKVTTNDKRGKASQSVKDRFCKQAKDQIKILEKPVSKDDTVRYLNELSKTITSLGGLTNRQIMHIRFFFSDDAYKMSKKNDEVNKLLKDTMMEFNSEKMKDYNLIGSIKSKMKEIDQKIENTKNSIEKTKELIHNEEDRINELKTDMQEIDISKIDETKSKLQNSESKLDRIGRDVDYYLSFEKLLKKLKHDKKLKNEILDMYINSPRKALIKDDDLKLLEFIKDLDQEDKKFEKAKYILDDPDKIKKLRQNFIDAQNEVEERKVELNELLPLLNKKDNIKNNQNISNENIQKLKNDIDSFEEEIENMLKNKENSKIELKGHISTMLSARII